MIQGSQNSSQNQSKKTNQSILAKRLFIARSKLGMSQRELAEEVGVSVNTIQTYEKQTIPKGEHLKRLALALNCSADWLLGLVGDDLYPESSSKHYPDPADDYVSVPLIEGQVTAGQDGGILYDRPDDMYPFKRWWIEKKVGHSEARHKALVLVRVRGESMIPTIYPGEITLVDTWEPERIEVAEGKIFLVRMPDGTITLKRVVMNVKHDKAFLVCLSDNPQFEPFKFEVEKPIQYYILGRIRWVGREID